MKNNQKNSQEKGGKKCKACGGVLREPNHPKNFIKYEGSLIFSQDKNRGIGFEMCVNAECELHQKLIEIDPTPKPESEGVEWLRETFSNIWRSKKTYQEIEDEFVGMFQAQAEQIRREERHCKTCQCELKPKPPAGFKKCRICKKFFSLSSFFPGMLKKHNYVCKSCSYILRKAWQKKNPDKVRMSLKKYREKYPEKTKNMTKDWIARNRNKYNAYQKKYRKEARAKILRDSREKESR